MQFDLFGSSGKMSPESCPTKQTPSDVCSELWWEQIPHSFQAEGKGGPVRVWLMDPSDPPLGESRMPNISAWPNDASVCSLWQVLETGRIPQKYFLTALACSGILRRAVKRGKELPALLARALKAVVDSARTLISGGGSYQLSPALTGSGRGVERTGESRGQDCVVPVMTKVHCFDARQNCVISYGDKTGPLDQNGHTHGIAVELSNGHISHCLNAGGMGRIDYETETLVTHALRAEGFDASALASGAHPPAVAFRAAGQDGFTPSEISPPVAASDGGGSGVPTVAFNLRGREGGAMPEVSDVASLRSADGGSSRSYIAQPWAVRRLTPIETARLQGFKDSYCHIPRKPRKIDQDEAEHYLNHGIDAYLDGEQWMTKAAADGSIYRAHGNSMAVNVMRWLGQRIVWSLRESATGTLSTPPKIITK